MLAAVVSGTGGGCHHGRRAPHRGGRALASRLGGGVLRRWVEAIGHK